MEYVYAVAAAVAATHTASFGAWLHGHGNRAGALFAWTLALVCLAPPLYGFSCSVEGQQVNLSYILLFLLQLLSIIVIILLYEIIHKARW